MNAYLRRQLEGVGSLPLLSMWVPGLNSRSSQTWIQVCLRTEQPCQLCLFSQEQPLRPSIGSPVPCGEDNARAEGPRDGAKATDLVWLSTMVGAGSKLGYISNNSRKNHCLVCEREPQAGCAVCILCYILWHRSSWPLASSCQTLQ